MTTASYRESHLHKGADYHDTFVSLPHRALIWKLERRLLLRLVRETFPDQPPRYLDFACGTGRILAHLAPHCSGAVGVDVSPLMLQVARRALPGVEIVQADITRDDRLGRRAFDLITAFRFFPNAETELRQEALVVLGRHLSADGVLVFNNHKHRGSLRRRLARARRWAVASPPAAPDRVMSRRETRELVAEAGLRIEREYHLGVLPLAERGGLQHLGLVEAAERVLARVAPAKAVAQHLIYVCRRV